MLNPEKILDFLIRWKPWFPVIVGCIVILALIIAIRKSLQDNPKSASIAALLSILFPGLGHVYVGEYGWAVLIFFINSFFTFMMVPPSVFSYLNPLYMNLRGVYSIVSVLLFYFVLQSSYLAFKETLKYNHTRLQVAMYKEIEEIQKGKKALK